MTWANNSFSPDKLVYLIIILVLTIALGGCGGAELIPTAPHHTSDGEFQNLGSPPKKRSFFSFFWMRLRTDWVDVAEGKDVPRVVTVPKDFEGDHLRQVTWLGHSCFLVQANGINLLTDPVFSRRASPVSFAGPERYTPPAMGIDQLPIIHAVIISHNHYDHLDVESIEKIDARSKPLWLVPLKNGPLLTDAGVDKKRVIELDWWQDHKVTIGKKSIKATFTPTPAQHWSARGLFDRNEMLWSSWAARLGDLNLYFGGDTGYQDEIFKQIGRKLGPFDLGIIPIGAYAPRDFMAPSHVQPEESVKIHQDVRALRSLGAHWGTFPLTAEPVMDPPKRLEAALKSVKLPTKTFIAPVLGKIYILDQSTLWPDLGAIN